MKPTTMANDKSPSSSLTSNCSWDGSGVERRRRRGGCRDNCERQQQRRNGKMEDDGVRWGSVAVMPGEREWQEWGVIMYYSRFMMLFLLESSLGV
jgi:hypothetical protein